MNMRENDFVIKCLVGLIAISFIGSGTVAQTGKGNLKYVDPTIGGVGHLLEPTRPTMHLPNSMVRMYPVRKDQLDDQIGYFPLSMYSHRIGNVFSVMPYTESNQQSAASKTTYDQEKTTPYYYTVLLEEPQVKVEYSPAERSGYYRFTSLSRMPVNLQFGIINQGSINVEGKRVLTGTEDFKGMKAFVYAEFNSDVSQSNASQSANKNLNLKSAGAVIDVKYGISFISIAQAKANLQKEIPNWSLEEVKQNAERIWENTLSQVNVRGGSEAQKRSFYTALYRTYERMVNINEYGKYYSAYDHNVHTDNRPFYVDNWIWDMYLAQEPLQMILNPEKEADKLQSYVKMYEQSGWMPDAWFKGIKNFDIKTGYEGVKKNSLQGTLLPWKNGPMTKLDVFYDKHGYFPALKPDEKETVPEVDGFEKRQSVAVTLQQSYDDWCLAKLAGALGYQKDTELFLRKSSNYKNVFRTDKGFMWPKDGDGKWIEPFDPKFSGGLGGRQYFTENNAYTYDWDVKHDLYGLFKLMGGLKPAEEKLDLLFRENLGRSKYTLQATFPDATGLVGQFVMGNEPSFHIPYLYNYLGSPWKTQKRIRSLLNTWFKDNEFGIPGDEDGGGMSAFVVFSMMGFYPVTPGSPVYTIGSPVFTETTVKLSNGKVFTIKADGSSDDAKYIESAKLNGHNLTKPWFTHQELVNGGTLEFKMSVTPNKAWGSTIQVEPQSNLK
jgi:putative alpha-1,2-mannosidase